MSPYRIYESWKPSVAARAIIEEAEGICADYQAQGYDLTLRQLYYQFVARGLIPNTQRDYKRLGEVINRGRMAGLLDWDYIVDRTRNLRKVSHWDKPSDIMEAAASSFRVDKWNDQKTRVEVWVEKEALAGVIERTSTANDCAWFSCRGYVSQSEMWAAAQRHLEYIEAGQNVVILHLGDHDPSGIDMTRDIDERLVTFILADWYREHHVEIDPASVDAVIGHVREHLEGREFLEVRRIALNMDQIDEYQPPPNPAKLTDSRSTTYVAEHGYESWELDALPPDVLDRLIREAIDDLRDPDAYALRADHEAQKRQQLEGIADRWDDITAWMETAGV